MREIALYVHVPFCIRKCRYCDFVSFPSCSEENIRHYFLTVAQELHFRVIHNKLQGTHLKSVYFGGGTPSLAPSDILSNFLQLLRQYFILDHSIEITLEANPGTIHSEKLRNLSNIGINRLSIGIQSFQDRYLSFLGRTYCSKDVFQLLDEFKTSEVFQNYSFDLIYGLPFQTFSEWKAEMKTLLRYQPPHFSIYNLTVNRKVPLYPFSTHHPMVFPDQDLLAGMYRWTKIVAGKQGYERYEISNFAQPGYECIHNYTYWRNQEYLGVGVSS